MDARFRCPDGHEWSDGAELPSTLSTQCPICGRAASKGLPVADDMPPTENIRRPCKQEASAPSAETHASTPVGTFPLIKGYEIDGELGQGGMGVVYRAKQEMLDRWVALKMIRFGFQTNAETRARFRTEASAIARLHHPNIVQIYEVGEQSGFLYFSLELVEGGTLRNALAGRPQPPGDCAEMVETLARAVQDAHDKGVVHRDLKPSNVLMTGDGVPKIADFGLAKLVEHEAPDGVDTQSGDVLGTPSYMAPEQARGQSERISPAVDVYALGAILYEMLTGRPPFAAPTSVETVLQVIGTEPLPPRRLQPKVPTDLETVCLKCLQKNPKQRYGSAGALAEDLSRYREGLPIHARPVSATEKLWRWTRRNPTVATLTALLLFVVVCAGIFGVRWLQEKTQRELDAQNQMAETRNKVFGMLQEATRKQGQARAAQVGDFSLWKEAIFHVRQAEKLAGAELDRDSQTRKRIAELKAALETELAQARKAADDAKKNAAMVKLLAEIESENDELDGEFFGVAATRKRIHKAFQDYGLNLEKQSSAELAAKIKQSPIRQALLDCLFSLGTRVNSVKEREYYFSIYSLANPDRKYADFLNAVTTRDHSALVTWAESDRALQLPARYMRAIARSLHNVGDTTRALVFMRRAQAQYPDHFWINYDLAGLLHNEVPPRRLEAVGYFRAALAKRPNNPGVMNDLGILLQFVGDLNESKVLHERAVALKPDLAHFRLNLAMLYIATEEFDLAEKHLHKAIELKENYAKAYLGLAQVYVYSGRFAKACETLRTAKQKVKKYDTEYYRIVQQLENAEVLAHLERELPGGSISAARMRSGAEAMRIAAMCYMKGWHISAARLADDALQRWPKLAEDRSGDWHRYNAACYATRAGCEKTKDPFQLNNKQKLAMRKQALAWLKADLKSWKRQIDGSNARQMEVIRNSLLEWKQDIALAGLRDEHMLRKLPPAEQAECRRLWQQLDALLQPIRQSRR